ncbi:hypothetical protein DND132_1930 [Pseudodesulfovibrio mercurii]|uniref:Uncharacterized protein n=1 Tax=Pseudodesulfovibrio mercurii TaxID=641491 RepID=F0JGU6_9BACT|nr:hypothetical protein [Pseudodesulfovibrio mercurii]EGB15136.1 hypothetical protein DND132_1930 [Pseudodesulfovibrio mercurii]
MRAGRVLFGVFAALVGLILLSLWNRSLHWNLWIGFLSPCLFPAVLLAGFGGAYRRGVEAGLIAGEDDFKRFMKRHRAAYAGLLGAAMVALWWREGFEAIPYILFFGLPFLIGGLLVATAVIGVLGYYRPVIGTLFAWLWLGLGVCYGASCLAMAARAWTAIPFLLLVVLDLARDGRGLLGLWRASPPWCLLAGALTLGWWYYDGFWKYPWRMTRVPYDLIPWAVGAGGALWAARRFGGGAVRRAAAIGGKGLATAVVVTVLLFAGAGGWSYLTETFFWRDLASYRVVFEAESAKGARRETSVITVERKVLASERTYAGALRVEGSLPSMNLPGKGVLRAELQMDDKHLRALPVIARKALEERSGEPVPVTGAPMTLVGRARPALWVVPADDIGSRRTVWYEDNGLGIRFSVRIEVLKGGDALNRLYVLRKVPD